MATEEQLDFLESDIRQIADSYKRRSRYNRRTAFLFTLAPATLSALTTVLVGTSEVAIAAPYQDILLIGSIIATALATVANIWAGAFSNRKLWVINNITITELEMLLFDIQLRRKDPAAITQNEFSDFKIRYDKIMIDSLNSWKNIIAG
jgi:hypothetical protein